MIRIEIFAYHTIWYSKTCVFTTFGFVLMLCFSNSRLGAQVQTHSVEHAFDAESYTQGMLEAREAKNLAYSTKGEAPFKREKDRKVFKGIAWFDVDTAWRVRARVDRMDRDDTLVFATSSGTTKTFLPYARLIFNTPDGQVDTLEAFRSLQNMQHPIYGKLLFVPFTDENSGEQCYGGGRYLDLPVSDEDSLILDFNEAYNPYCAYSEGWFCPIPPSQNHVNSPVNAGEKDYRP